MRNRVKKTAKICGTCNFWQGQREIVQGANGQEYLRLKDRSGRCCNPQSRSHDAQKANDSGCVCYLCLENKTGN